MISAFITVQIFSLLVGAPNAAAAELPGTHSNRTILFLRKSGSDFTQVYQSMTKDLGKYSVKDMIVNEETPFSDFALALKREKPDLTILMDNRAIEFGLKWNQENPKPIRGVALMGLNIQALLKGNKTIAGISFEPPAYNLFTQFRYLTKTPVKRALVLYRSSVFSEIIQLAKSQLAMEQIELDAVDVEQKGKGPAEIERYLKENIETLLVSKPYDVLWCLLDSKLLTPTLFTGVWHPLAQKIRIPILTGVEQLVRTDLSFGTFAVTPDLPDLASQAVQIVDRLLEGGEAPSKIGVEQLISVSKVLNLKKAKSLGIQVHEDRVMDVKVLD